MDTVRGVKFSWVRRSFIMLNSMISNNSKFCDMCFINAIENGIEQNARASKQKPKIDENKGSKYPRKFPHSMRDSMWLFKVSKRSSSGCHSIEIHSASWSTSFSAVLWVYYVTVLFFRSDPIPVPFFSSSHNTIYIIIIIQMP